MNINAVDPSYFNSFAAEMAGKFRRIDHLVSHGGTTGNYHEEILRVFLRNFLSKRFSVKSGFVFEDNEHVSKQIDILVIDENHPASYIFQEGDFAIVRPEGLVAAIEVKTTLSASEFKSSVENIKSVKNLLEFPTNIVGAIFGYHTDGDNVISDQKIHNWFKNNPVDRLSGNRDTGADAVICFMDNHSLFRFNKETNTINDSDSYRKFYLSENVTDPNNETGWQLSMLIALVISACEKREFQSTRQFGQGQANKLLGSENILVSDDAYKFGEGKLDG